MTSKSSDILVLGATGLTGRQTVKFLAAHPDRQAGKFTLAIAARSRQKLDALVSDLSLSKDIRLITLDVTNEAAVEEAARNTRIIVNTVGPYMLWGTPVVRSCARHGIHYVDLTGESNWIAKIIREFDYQASKTCSIIVPSCGFDSVPADLSVYIANKAIKDVHPSLGIETSTTAYSVKGIISSGTLNSMIGLRDENTKALRGDHILSPVKGRPSPRPSAVYQVQLPGSRKTIVGGFWLMALANRAIVQRSWGLFEHAALSNSTLTSTRYGPSMVYDEFLRTPGKLLAAVVSTSLAMFWGLLGFTPIRWLIQSLIPSNVTTASDEKLDTGSFTTINITTSTTSAEHPQPVKVTTTLKGRGDPGYLLSPIWMAECALSLLDTKALPKMAQQGGILTPATAFGDVLVKRLEANERFTLHQEVHIGDESKKTI